MKGWLLHCCPARWRTGTNRWIWVRPTTSGKGCSMKKFEFLVDANVLSETSRILPDPGVVKWLEANERGLAIDPVIFGEVKSGILSLPEGRKKAELESWFTRGVARLHCFDWTCETAICWAEMIARLRREGARLPAKDGMIAATALFHDLTVVTRNEKDFLNTGVRILNPFEN